MRFDYTRSGSPNAMGTSVSVPGDSPTTPTQRLQKQRALVVRAPLPAQIIGRALPSDMPETARHSAILEQTRVSRSRRSWPCPVCGEIDGQCIIYPDPDSETLLHVWCIRGEGYEGAIHLPNWGFRQDRGGAWYVSLDGKTGTVHRLRSADITRDHPLANAETIDHVLRSTARAFGLSTHHRTQLTKRGYDPKECGPDARYLFASLPSDVAPRMGVAATLMKSFADASDLLGTFGYSQDRRRHNDGIIAFLPAVDGSALLELITDVDGRVVGFQYAPDAPQLDAKGKPKKRLTPSRMTLLGRYHIGRPVADAGLQVWHTEALHKANLTARARRAPAVGYLGAGNASKNVEAAARALDPEARRLHVVALDADQWGGKEENGTAQKLLDRGYRVGLARWDPKHKGPDDAIVAGAAITLLDFADGRPKPRQDARIAHAYPWQQAEEDATMRASLLDGVQDRVEQHLRAHFDQNHRGEVLVIASPPGAGKSTRAAHLGVPNTAYPRGEYELAWIAQRHAMVDSNPCLPRYLHIEPCGPKNCPQHDVHNALSAAGYNTAPMHHDHALGPCAYIKQFEQRGSAVFMPQHVPTTYPASRDAVVIDELVIAEWAPEREFTVARLREAAQQWLPDSRASLLLRALQALLTDTASTNSPLDGKEFFEALDERCGGQLVHWVASLQNEQRAYDEHPHALIDPNDVNALEEANKLPPVIFPHIWAALFRELPKWQKGTAWNSLIRIGPATVSGEYGLYITNWRRFRAPKDGQLPPIALLDATADEELLTHLFGTPVKVIRETVNPPPHTRHIAVRTGKRYSKTALADTRNPESRTRSIARVAAELRYLLSELDPEGSECAAGHVGLITHLGCERELAEALDIPYGDPVQDTTDGRTGHFWNTRGSNQFEQCSILFVVGTPTMNPDHLLRLARALYADDPEPLNEGATKTEDGWRYDDPRVQRVANTMSRDELTQCAHRSRPLRYDGRTVVTLCAEQIDYLPATTTITRLPQLTEDGTKRSTKQQAAATARMDTAWATLQERGERISAQALCALAQVRKADACAYLREKQASPVDDYVNLQAVPEMQLINITAKWEPVDRYTSASPERAFEPVRRSFSERLDELTAAGMREDLAIARLLAENEARDRARGNTA